MRFDLNKAKLVQVATAAQRTFCVYDMFPLGRIGRKDKDVEPGNPPNTCDCKYGATNIGGGHELGNGCPEMRQLVAVLEEMTQKELRAIQRRLEKQAERRARETNKAWQKIMHDQRKEVQP